MSVSPENSSVTDPLDTCALEARSPNGGGFDTDAICCSVNETLVGEGLQASSGLSHLAIKRHAGEILNSRKRVLRVTGTLDEFNTNHSETTPTQHHQSPGRAISTPNSLKGKATWFTFTGCAAPATLYGCADFVTVYNFPVSPELSDFYKWIVETHGHIPSVVVLLEKYTLITSTRVLIDFASAMQKLGEACPSEEDWASWQEVFKLPRILKFNIAWLESLLAGIEERRNSRRLLLSGEIAQLEEEVAEGEQKLKKHQATQLRLATEVAAIVLEIQATKSDIDVKRRSPMKKNNELAALP
ncbi:hypothetical protein C5167_004181 [Papaver somniferum]|uniref:uncharacterized protein LOC113332430 n=1 Tax=Papaver somniferum TaxID=3469 RepID=UPI000E6F4F04|nr:uncharacterized protein LOC113332430 [Papaver somniferum]RZC88002.1 hypothetical protein C5167_004181 [Papaver somniferum]